MGAEEITRYDRCAALGTDIAICCGSSRLLEGETAGTAELSGSRGGFSATGTGTISPNLGNFLAALIDFIKQGADLLNGIESLCRGVSLVELVINLSKLEIELLDLVLLFRNCTVELGSICQILGLLCNILGDIGNLLSDIIKKSHRLPPSVAISGRFCMYFKFIIAIWHFGVKNSLF